MVGTNVEPRVRIREGLAVESCPVGAGALTEEGGRGPG
jgi:hypothetical protein